MIEVLFADSESASMKAAKSTVIFILMKSRRMGVIGKLYRRVFGKFLSRQKVIR